MEDYRPIKFQFLPLNLPSINLGESERFQTVEPEDFEFFAKLLSINAT
jgi:hypothetical protein